MYFIQIFNFFIYIIYDKKKINFSFKNKRNRYTIQDDLII